MPWTMPRTTFLPTSSRMTTDGLLIFRAFLMAAIRPLASLSICFSSAFSWLFRPARKPLPASFPLSNIRSAMSLPKDVASLLPDAASLFSFAMSVVVTFFCPRIVASWLPGPASASSCRRSLDAPRAFSDFDRATKPDAVFCWLPICDRRSPMLVADVPLMDRKSLMFDAWSVAYWFASAIFFWMPARLSASASSCPPLRCTLAAVRL